MENELRRQGMDIIRNVHRMIILLSRGMTRRVAASGINFPQFSALVALAGPGEAIMSDLAEELGTTMGAVTNLVDRLVFGGYVERRRDETDRRLVRVTITDAGRRIVDEQQGWGAESLARFLEQLSPEERKAFIRTFARLVDHTDGDFSREGFRPGRLDEATDA